LLDVEELLVVDLREFDKLGTSGGLGFSTVTAVSAV
jgi:hypothetical protein